MRSGQALFEVDELLVECYVDDLWIALAGEEDERMLNAATLLLWWRVLGPRAHMLDTGTSGQVRDGLRAETILGLWR